MMSKMHIVFLTHEYPTLNPKHGGVGSVVQTLARKLSDQGISISVVGTYPVETEKIITDGRVTIYPVPFSRWKFARFWDNSKRILRKLNEIHRQNPIHAVEGAELSFAFFPEKTPYKKVIRMHGGHHFFAVTLGKKPRMWRSFQEKQSFKKADALVAVSRYVGETTKKLLDFDKDFEVIYNIVDTGKFHPADPSKTVKGRIFFAGTLTEKKGIRHLILALSEIVRQVPHAHLVVAGRDWRFPDGRSYMDYLQQFIAPALKDKIEFLGPVPHEKIPQLIERAEICVYPSLSESFGLVALEALLMQKPTVLSDISIYREIVSSEGALFVKPAQTSDMAQSIADLLKSPEKRLKLSERGRAEALNKFNPEKIIRNNIEFYARIIENNG